MCYYCTRTVCHLIRGFTVYEEGTNDALKKLNILTSKQANELLSGKTLDHIGDNGDNSQILYFTDGTRVNVFNDWFNEEGLKYQLMEDDKN